jgi:tyrosine-protein kinase Etk/Wzc
MRPTAQEEAPLTLREIADMLREGRWLLAGSLAAALALGALSILVREPVYRADGLLQIEDRDRALDPLSDDPTGGPAEVPTEAEIDLIRSRSVVMDVIRTLQLDVAVRPVRPPIVGRLLGLGGRLQVDSLEVAPELLGEPLTLVVQDATGYALLDPGGQELLQGRVGTTVSGDRAAVLVSHLAARPGARFVVVKQPPAQALERFLGQLTVSERGRNTGVIALELRGPRPDQIQAALQALMEAYLRRDVEHRARVAERRLEFVNSQLPVLKESLEQAELRLKQYRTQTGQLDIGLESKAMIDRGVELDAQIIQLRLQISELRQRFTDSHPNLVALNTKLRQLARARSRLDAQVVARPDTELSWARLDRDVKVAAELYVQLLARAQELSVWKAANISSVRMVDPAFVQPRPVKPDVSRTLAVSLLLGGALGLGLVLGRQGLRRGVHTASSLEQALGLPVYACLPRGRGMALCAPDDPRLEALRALRTRLLHELAGAPSKAVVLTSSRPHAGCAFVAANLAVVCAAAGKKVLLVDADLRRGPLRRYFPRARAAGLADLLSGGSLEELLSPVDVPNLHLLASGRPPLAPSELLCRPAFAGTLQAASQRYDLVLCAAPPVLSASDAAIASQAAGSTLLVVEAYRHSLDELALAASRLSQCGGRPRGFVVNEARAHFEHR